MSVLDGEWNLGACQVASWPKYQRLQVGLQCKVCCQWRDRALQASSGCQEILTEAWHILQIHNDILASLDAGKVTALTLLDLSAVFDTIDHTILIRGLDDWFGVTGKALDWFKSYLTGKCQRIKLGDCLPSKTDLKFGVLQRSVLGPLLFTLYTTPLSSIICEHAIPHHLYADDSQLYVSFTSGDSAAALNGLQSCLASVQSWMSTNKLKLNPDKTEFLLVGMNDSRANISLCFLLSFSVSKLNRTLRKKQPVYPHSMLDTSLPSRSLRSNNDNSLSVPRVKTNTGARAFHFCAPSLGNNLPLSGRSAISLATFKKHLKTHLFDLAFPP